METYGFVEWEDTKSLVSVPVPESSLTLDTTPIDKSIGYSRWRIEETRFREHFKGLVVGPPKSSDGKIHTLTYLAHIPVIGEVRILEQSYATNPDATRVAIGKPYGNIVAKGGVEGTFVVQKNSIGLGKSVAVVATNGKLMIVTAPVALLRASEDEAEFRELVETLE